MVPSQARRPQAEREVGVESKGHSEYGSPGVSFSAETSCKHCNGRTLAIAGRSDKLQGAGRSVRKHRNVVKSCRSSRCVHCSCGDFQLFASRTPSEVLGLDNELLIGEIGRTMRLRSFKPGKRSNRIDAKRTGLVPRGSSGGRKCANFCSAC